MTRSQRSRWLPVVVAVVALLSGGCDLQLTTTVAVAADGEVPAVSGRAELVVSGSAAEALADPARRSELVAIWTDRTGREPTVTDAEGGQVVLSGPLDGGLPAVADLTGLAAVSVDPAGDVVTIGVTLVRPDGLIDALLASGDESAALTAAQLTDVVVVVAWPDGWVPRTHDAAGVDVDLAPGQMVLTRNLAQAAEGRATVVVGPSAGGETVPVAIGAVVLVGMLAVAGLWVRRRSSSSG